MEDLVTKIYTRNIHWSVIDFLDDNLKPIENVEPQEWNDAMNQIVTQLRDNLKNKILELETKTKEELQGIYENSTEWVKWNEEFNQNITEQLYKCYLDNFLLKRLLQNDEKNLHEIQNNQLEEKNKIEEFQKDRNHNYESNEVNEIQIDNIQNKEYQKNEIKKEENSNNELITKNILKEKLDTMKLADNFNEKFDKINTCSKKRKILNYEKESKKIKLVPCIQGFLVIKYDKNYLSGAIAFTLASFSHVIKDVPCHIDWLKKLSFYVKQMNINHLFVRGYQQVNFLRPFLPEVKINPIEGKREDVKCEMCQKYCSMGKIKLYFKKYYNYDYNESCY